MHKFPSIDNGKDIGYQVKGKGNIYDKNATSKNKWYHQFINILEIYEGYSVGANEKNVSAMISLLVKYFKQYFSSNGKLSNKSDTLTVCQMILPIKTTMHQMSRGDLLCCRCACKALQAKTKQ